MIRAERRGCQVRITGHAGAAPAGRDLVCAAVSALAWTLGANLERLEKTGALEALSVRMAPGCCLARCTPAPGREAQVQAVFDTLWLGLEGLAKHYSQWVRCRTLQ